MAPPASATTPNPLTLISQPASTYVLLDEGDAVLNKGLCQSPYFTACFVDVLPALDCASAPRRDAGDAVLNEGLRPAGDASGDTRLLNDGDRGALLLNDGDRPVTAVASAPPPGEEGTSDGSEREEVQRWSPGRARKTSCLCKRAV